MSDVSYKVQLSVSAENRDKVKKTFGEMLDLWKSMSGDFELDEMVLKYDDATGVFDFDTKGIVGVSPALMDDTNLILREIGNAGEAGAVVQHKYNGVKSDFAIGPTAEARQAAMEDDQYGQAIGHLERAKALCPGDIKDEIDKIIATLQKLA